MSNVSNRHALQLFSAGDKPFTGQRLAKVGYKTSKKTPAKFKSVATSIPFVQVDDIHGNITALLPFIGAMIENAQDGIIKSLYESAHGALIDITDDDISVSACIGFMQAESAGDRLTSEAIGKWFDSELSENLLASVADKLGFVDSEGAINEDQEIVCKKHVKVYRDVLCMLAGGKTILAEKQIKGCKNALALSPDDSDVMVVRLTARLDGMLKKEKIEDLLEL